MFIVNHLPIKVGGKFSSNPNQIYFTRDSNLCGLYSSRTLTIPKLDLEIVTEAQHPVTTINENPYYNISISVALHQTEKTYIFYFRDSSNNYNLAYSKGQFAFTVDPVNDTFFAHGKTIFIIPANDSKNIYRSLLSANQTITFTKMTSSYNTIDGQEESEVVKSPFVCPVGNGYFLFLGGICGSTDYIYRLYKWDSQQNTFLFLQNNTNNKEAPYKNVGYFYNVNSSTIMGLNCSYETSYFGFSETGVNKVYSFNSETASITVNTMTFSINLNNFMNSAKLNMNGGYFWKRNPKVISYRKSDSKVYTTFSYDNYSYLEVENLDFTNMGIMFGVYDNGFYSVKRVGINDSTTLNYNTISPTTIISTPKISTGIKVAFFKIPGLPVIYADTDITTNQNATLYCSLAQNTPILLPGGSTIKKGGTVYTVTDTHIPYPNYEEILDISATSKGFNKKIYGFTKNDRGFNL